MILEDNDLAAIRRDVIQTIVGIYQANGRLDDVQMLVDWLVNEGEWEAVLSPAATEPPATGPSIDSGGVPITVTGDGIPITTGDGGPISTDNPAPPVDSAGVPFDPAIHTGTKTKTGKWRRKRGVTGESQQPAEPTVGEPQQAVEQMKFADFLQLTAKADLTPSGFGEWLQDRYNMTSIELMGRPDLYQTIIDQLKTEGYLNE